MMCRIGAIGWSFLSNMKRSWNDVLRIVFVDTPLSLSIWIRNNEISACSNEECDLILSGQAALSLST